jgi:hypothetical protein
MKIGYTFEGKPHDDLPDVVGKLMYRLLVRGGERSAGVIRTLSSSSVLSSME